MGEMRIDEEQGEQTGAGKAMRGSQCRTERTLTLTLYGATAHQFVDHDLHEVFLRHFSRPILINVLASEKIPGSNSSRRNS